MADDVILMVLKTDLQISAEAYDEYLKNIIAAASAAIENEGIKLEDTIEDGMLVEQYAAFLFRKRKEDNVAMPRYLRWQLNNRLFSQKGKYGDDNQAGT